VEGGNEMKKRLFFCIFEVLAITLLLFSFGWAQSKPDSKAPMITHSFAVEKAYYGYVWKIYIEAEDPDGDMSRIATVVDQTGYGRYPADWIMIKSQYRNRLRGYLQWNTFSSRTSYLTEWTRITLRVSVIDKAGNESNEVIFPFTFQTGIKNPDKYELPSPFSGGDLPRLGYIHIDLIDPTILGSGDSRDD
jgi:hypothetical protein